MKILVLNEMAKIGTLKIRQVYDVYFRIEDNDINNPKPDHVHLKQKGQDVATFWLTKDNKFIIKRSKDSRIKLKEPIERVAKELERQGFADLVKSKAIELRGEPIFYEEYNIWED